MDKMKMESPDMTAQNIDRIAALFPNCITETVDENGKLKRAINFAQACSALPQSVILEHITITPKSRAKTGCSGAIQGKIKQ